MESLMKDWLRECYAKHPDEFHVFHFILKNLNWTFSFIVKGWRGHMIVVANDNV